MVSAAGSSVLAGAALALPLGDLARAALGGASSTVASVGLGDRLAARRPSRAQARRPTASATGAASASASADGAGGGRCLDRLGLVGLGRSGLRLAGRTGPASALSRRRRRRAPDWAPRGSRGRWRRRRLPRSSSGRKRCRHRRRRTATADRSPAPRILSGLLGVRTSPTARRMSALIVIWAEPEPLVALPALPDGGAASNAPRSTSASMAPTFTTSYSTLNRFLKPRSFGMRMWSGVWPPSNQGGIEPPARAFWPLVPRPAVLPLPAAMPRPTRVLALCAPSAGAGRAASCLLLAGVGRRPASSTSRR